MTNRTTFLVLVLAAGLAGCDDGAPAPVPTAPPSVATPPTYPPAVYTVSHVTLSGLVFEETANGRAPIEGVDVHCELCGVETHAWSTTDSNGLFSFTAVWRFCQRELSDRQLVALWRQAHGDGQLVGEHRPSIVQGLNSA